MSDALSIGDFSVITHLSVKTLRYYHQVGLLEPAEVDPHTGYRRYQVEQIPTAQIIQRFRDLDMPIDEVKAVLAAPDLDTRNALIAAGNSGDAGLLPAIERLLADASPLVRAMAVWALKQLADAEAWTAARRYYADREPDSAVRVEWGPEAP